MAGWITCQQDAAIDYLCEENRVLKQQLGRKKLRLTDDQRRRIAVLGKALGRQVLTDVTSLVTLGRTTISNIFKENGIDPAPERGKRTTWNQFLKAHWNVLAAADFFNPAQAP